MLLHFTNRKTERNTPFCHGYVEEKFFFINLAMRAQAKISMALPFYLGKRSEFKDFQDLQRNSSSWVPCSKGASIFHKPKTQIREN